MDHERKSFQERLSAFAENARQRAELLPPGPAKEAALTKIRQAETAANLDTRLTSGG